MITKIRSDGGVVVVLQGKAKKVIVKQVSPESDAFFYVNADDVLVEIDGQTVTGAKQSKLKQLMSGQPGSILSLQIEQPQPISSTVLSPRSERKQQQQQQQQSVLHSPRPPPSPPSLAFRRPVHPLTEAVKRGGNVSKSQNACALAVLSMLSPDISDRISFLTTNDGVVVEMEEEEGGGLDEEEEDDEEDEDAEKKQPKLPPEMISPNAVTSPNFAPSSTDIVTYIARNLIAGPPFAKETSIKSLLVFLVHRGAGVARGGPAVEFGMKFLMSGKGPLTLREAYGKLMQKFCESPMLAHKIIGKIAAGLKKGGGGKQKMVLLDTINLLCQGEVESLAFRHSISLCEQVGNLISLVTSLSTHSTKKADLKLADTALVTLCHLSNPSLCIKNDYGAGSSMSCADIFCQKNLMHLWLAHPPPSQPKKTKAKVKKNAAAAAGGGDQSALSGVPLPMCLKEADPYSPKEGYVLRKLFRTALGNEERLANLWFPFIGEQQPTNNRQPASNLQIMSFASLACIFLAAAGGGKWIQEETEEDDDEKDDDEEEAAKQKDIAAAAAAAAVAATEAAEKKKKRPLKKKSEVVPTPETQPDEKMTIMRTKTDETVEEEADDVSKNNSSLLLLLRPVAKKRRKKIAGHWAKVCLERGGGEEISLCECLFCQSEREMDKQHDFSMFFGGERQPPNSFGDDQAEEEEGSAITFEKLKRKCLSEEEWAKRREENKAVFLYLRKLMVKGRFLEQAIFFANYAVGEEERNDWRGAAGLVSSIFRLSQADRSLWEKGGENVEIYRKTTMDGPVKKESSTVTSDDERDYFHQLQLYFFKQVLPRFIDLCSTKVKSGLAAQDLDGCNLLLKESIQCLQILPLLDWRKKRFTEILSLQTLKTLVSIICDRREDAILSNDALELRTVAALSLRSLMRNMDVSNLLLKERQIEELFRFLEENLDADRIEEISQLLNPEVISESSDISFQTAVTLLDAFQTRQSWHSGTAKLWKFLSHVTECIREAAITSRLVQDFILWGGGKTGFVVRLMTFAPGLGGGREVWGVKSAAAGILQSLILADEINQSVANQFQVVRAVCGFFRLALNWLSGFDYLSTLVKEIRKEFLFALQSERKVRNQAKQMNEIIAAAKKMWILVTAATDFGEKEKFTQQAEDMDRTVEEMKANINIKKEETIMLFSALNEKRKKAQSLWERLVGPSDAAGSFLLFRGNSPEAAAFLRNRKKEFEAEVESGVEAAIWMLWSLEFSHSRRLEILGQDITDDLMKLSAGILGKKVRLAATWALRNLRGGEVVLKMPRQEEVERSNGNGGNEDDDDRVYVNFEKANLFASHVMKNLDRIEKERGGAAAIGLGKGSVLSSKITNAILAKK